jgi:hypothetical protein
MGIRFAVMAAVSCLAGAGAACADTIYTLARVNGDVFAINPADISDLGGGRKTATYYFIHPTHQADAYVTEFDCAGGRSITQTHNVIRSDLSPVRTVRRDAAWETPDSKAVSGILLKFVCAWPSPPAALQSATADSTAQFVRTTADSLLAKRGAADLKINPDRNTVGDCIFSQMPREVASKALINAQTARSPSTDQAFRDKVKTLGAKCSGRAESDNDSLIIGAALSVYMRFGSVIRLAEKSKIAENHLAAAWNAAPASVRAPLLERAAMLNSNATVSDIETANTQAVQASVKTLMATPALAAVLAGAKDLNGPQKDILVSQYYMAVAMGEQSEAALAPSKPVKAQ